MCVFSTDNTPVPQWPYCHVTFAEVDIRPNHTSSLITSYQGSPGVSGVWVHQFIGSVLCVLCTHGTPDLPAPPLSWYILHNTPAGINFMQNLWELEWFASCVLLFPPTFNFSPEEENGSGAVSRVVWALLWGGANVLEKAIEYIRLCE